DRLGFPPDRPDRLYRRVLPDARGDRVSADPVGGHHACRRAPRGKWPDDPDRRHRQRDGGRDARQLLLVSRRARDRARTLPPVDREARALADDGLGRRRKGGEAVRALRRSGRRRRTDAPDGALDRVRPGGVAPHAAAQLPDLVDDRHRRMERGARGRRLGARPSVRRDREDSRPALHRGHRRDHRRLRLSPAHLAQTPSL
ncbi:MAG: DedA family protein, partial [uncultured Sphingomonadaceae bacterium]